MAFWQLLIWSVYASGLARGNEVYNGGMVSDDSPVNEAAFQDDPHCTHHIHKFYRQMKCEPEITPLNKCPSSYYCASLQGRSPDRCYYGGRYYAVGFNLTRADADFHSPCIQSCQCVRMYEGARFYCTQSPRESCQSPPGCRHFSFLEDFNCCQRGITSCNQGKEGSVKCVYEGRSYSEGERFFPSDDITCTQCVCGSGFNGTIAPPYCHQFACDLELWGDTPVMLTRGCIPVYLSDTGCCPVTFRCPKPTDWVVRSDSPPPKLRGKPGKPKCHFGNLTMDVGDQLSPWTETNAKTVECSCRVPPLPSCVRRQFVLTEDIRRQFAREGLDNQSLKEIETQEE